VEEVGFHIISLVLNNWIFELFVYVIQALFVQ